MKKVGTHTRAAVLGDIDGIMHVEQVEFEGLGASREQMLERIALLNNDEPKFFAVAEEGNRITGYMIMMPTNMNPDHCTSWEHATGNGSMSTYAPDGPNLYVVSIGALKPPNAAAGTSYYLQLHCISLWMRYGGLCMFCSRMAGFRAAQEKGADAETYWCQKKPDGTYVDAWVNYFAELTGTAPTRLLPDGYKDDEDSLGYAVFFVLSEPQRAFECTSAILVEAASTEGVLLERRRRRKEVVPHTDLKYSLLDAGSRLFWDVLEHCCGSSRTLLLPMGCADWDKCTFCSLPRAVEEWLRLFHDGKSLEAAELIALFDTIFDHVVNQNPNIGTLMLFMGGSWFAEQVNPWNVQEHILRRIAEADGVTRLVVESRAPLVNNDILTRTCEVLGKPLTVRFGVETASNMLRTRLGKGHPHRELVAAVKACRSTGVLPAGYVMVNPAPSSVIRSVMGDPDADAASVDRWIVEEGCQSIAYVLGDDVHALNMTECCVSATCPAPESPLARAWETGDFYPPTLNMMWEVLSYGVDRFGDRVHLLPENDAPPPLRVCSNHKAEGVLPDLSDARGCDLVVRQKLELYRTTHNPHVLIERIPCDCWM